MRGCDVSVAIRWASSFRNYNKNEIVHGGDGERAKNGKEDNDVTALRALLRWNICGLARPFAAGGVA